MKFLRYLLPATLSLLIATNVGSQTLNLDLKGKAKGKISSFKDAKIHAYTPVSYTHLTLPTNREV